jgi:hypothetical protein
VITPRGQSVVSRRSVGERYATRVRIAAPQGSRYDGERGFVVDIVRDTLLVQLRPGLVLPFGAGEVEVIEERSAYQ